MQWKVLENAVSASIGSMGFGGCQKVAQQSQYQAAAIKCLNLVLQQFWNAFHSYLSQKKLILGSIEKPAELP